MSVNFVSNKHATNRMERQTALELAIMNNDTKIVELLTNYGANTNEMLSNRWMPLQWSIEQGFERVADILINNGANVNYVGIEDKSSLHNAAEKGGALN